MKKGSFKKLPLFMATTLLLTSLPVNAYDLDERRNSVEYIEYQESTNYELHNQTDVYAEIGSDFSATIPKVIVLSGENKFARFTVNSFGDIAGYEVLHIVPDDVVNLYTPNKAMQLGVIDQDFTAWRWYELGIEANGSVQAPGITAGRWSGSFNFTIWLDTVNETMVLGDLLLPPDLDDSYRLLIKSINDDPGLYDIEGNLLADYETLIEEFNFDVAADGNQSNSPASVINNYYPETAFVSLPGKLGSIRKSSVSNPANGSGSGSGTSNGPTSIGSGAFAGTNVKYVKIPNSVRSIGANAFSGTGLVYASVPDSVTSVGTGAFDNTPVSESNQIYYNNKPVEKKSVNLEDYDSDTIYLEVGRRYQIEALYNFINNVTNESTIASSDPETVLFTSNCYLDALKVGTSTISGVYTTVDGRQKNATINVVVGGSAGSLKDVPSANAKLSEMTPLQIKALARSGQILNYDINVGDQIDIGNGYKAEVVDLGSNFVQFATTTKVVSATTPVFRTIVNSYRGDGGSVLGTETVTSDGPAAFNAAPIDGGYQHSRVYSDFWFGNSSIKHQLDAWFNSMPEDFKSAVGETQRYYDAIHHEGILMSKPYKCNDELAKTKQSARHKVYIPTLEEYQTTLAYSDTWNNQTFWLATPNPLGKNIPTFMYGSFYCVNEGHVSTARTNEGKGAIAMFTIQ